MKKLDGRVVIVTGGAGGQGAAAARLYAEQGAKVVVADLSEAEGTRVAEKIGDAAVFQRLDVGDEASWADCIDRTKARWGRIDALLNNAGVMHVASIIDHELRDFERVVRVNLIGPWLGIKSVAPTMIAQGKGAIVNIGSTASVWGMHGIAAYSSSKWGLRGLTKAAAMELGHRGIRVNAIFPGGVDTAMAGGGGAAPVEDLNRSYMRQPIQRIGDPAEVANVSLFLISDDSSYMCGSELTVDGGLTLGVYKDYLPGAPGGAADAEA
jgi:3alpha(or 20beta)-hydroxysteroid dehydrogenase